MTYSSCAGSRSNDMKGRRSEAIEKRAGGNGLPVDKLPVNLESSPLVAERGATKPEISISGGQLLVALVVAFCLAGPLVWSFVRYWLFAP